MKTLIDMKNTKAEAKKEADPGAFDPPAYPWGLSVNLDDVSLEKLGLKSLPEIGAEMMLTARVEVSSRSEYDSSRGGKSRSLCLQITDMALDAASSKGSVSKAFYDETE